VGRDLFGGEIEEELEDISGRKIIGRLKKSNLSGKMKKQSKSKLKLILEQGSLLLILI
jgi:hypothetical protein